MITRGICRHLRCQCVRFPRCCLSANTRPQEKVSRENCEPCPQLSHGRSLYYGQIGSRAAQLWSCCLQPEPPFYVLLRASARETGADLEMKVNRFCSKSVHKVVMYTYVICHSFSFNDLFPAEFWISAPQGSSKADFQCNFGHFSISLLATYN